MAQAFARFFKRVGLPVDIPPFGLNRTGGPGTEGNEENEEKALFVSFVCFCSRCQRKASGAKWDYFRFSRMRAPRFWLRRSWSPATSPMVPR
jgi:hypothetical protein